jgi:hypothetical protein
MQKKLFFPIVLFLLLVACGGGSETPSPTLTPTGGNVTVPDSGSNDPEPSNETADPTPESVSEEPTTETSSEVAPTEAGEAATAPASAELLMSGTDPETGLEINPEQIVAGMEFIVRGEIVSMTLLPQDAPEFVIISPAGKRYRFRPQPISQIFYEDGTQPTLQDYRNGMLASATVFLDPAGGTSAVASSSNMMLHLTGN